MNIESTKFDVQRWAFDAYSPPLVDSMFIFETNPAWHEYNL